MPQRYKTRGKANVQNKWSAALWILVGEWHHKRSEVLAGMLKTAAFVVPTAGVVGGSCEKAYETLLCRNALLRLANTPKR